MHWKKKIMNEPTSILDETTGNFSSGVVGNEIMAMEPSTSQSQVITVEEIQEQPSNTVEVRTEKETPVAMELEQPDGLLCETETVFKFKGSELALAEFFKKDQCNRINSLSDAKIVCANGWLPFHRYILMAVSPWIMETWIYEDPSDVVIIHLPDVRVEHVVQAFSVLYSGNTTLYRASEWDDIFQIFQMLEIDCRNLQTSKAEVGDSIPTPRFYVKKAMPEENAPSDVSGNEDDDVVEVDVIDDINSEFINMDERELCVEKIALHAGQTVISEAQGSQDAGRSHATSYAGANIESGTNSQDNSQNVVCIDLCSGDENDVPMKMMNEEMQHGSPRVTTRKNETTKKSMKLSSYANSPFSPRNDALETQQENILWMDSEDSQQNEVFTTTMMAKNRAERFQSSPNVVTRFENTTYLCTSPESDSCYTNGQGTTTPVPETGCSRKDISKMSIPELRLLLTECGVCKRSANDPTWASHCHRVNHSCRRCWICLQLVSLKGKRSFVRHMLKHKIPGTHNKIKIACPICQDPYEYKWGIDVHCRHHFSKLLGIKKERKLKNTTTKKRKRSSKGGNRATTLSNDGNATASTTNENYSSNGEYVKSWEELSEEVFACD